MRTEAEAIARDIRDRTVDVCIKAIESLYLDSQGLILDADTLDACTSLLRNLKAQSAAALQEQGGGER